MKGLRIGRRRSRADGPQRSPVEVALAPALDGDRWRVPDRFNFTRDVVEALAGDLKRPAVTFLGPDGIIEPRTFSQIAEGAARWAHELREQDVEPGDRVVVLTACTVDWLEIMLACIKIGAVSVPTAPDLSAPALESRVAASGAALVVADEDRRDELAQLSFTPDVFYVDGRSRRTSDVPDDSPTHNTSQRDLAFIVATTGTTGEPKAVAHTHGAVFAARAQAEHWLDAGPGDAVWCTLDWGSPEIIWNTLVGPWSRGAEVVLHHAEEFDPRERLDLLYRLSPTILCQTPAEYRALAGVRELSRFRSPRLRRLVSTGDHLEAEVVAVFEEKWGMTIHEGYGQAETNVVLANSDEEGFKPGSIGRPVPGHHVAVIDDQGNELPVGIEGDLAVRGRPPTLFAGYWEAPEETKSAFRGDWYLTGDVATMDDDGFFWFLGRAEDVIASRGRTFGPYGIEQALRGHETVTESAAVGLPDLERGGQFVRAFVVLHPRAVASEQLEAELREFVGESLPEQQVPREIEFVDDLPMANGRVRRTELRERPVSRRPLWEAAAEQAAPAPPPEPTPQVPASPPTPAPAVPAEPPTLAPPAPRPVEEVVEWVPEQAAEARPVEEVVEWVPEQAAERRPAVEDVVEWAPEPTAASQPGLEEAPPPQAPQPTEAEPGAEVAPAPPPEPPAVEPAAEVAPARPPEPPAVEPAAEAAPPPGPAPPPEPIPVRPVEELFRPEPPVDEPLPEAVPAADAPSVAEPRPSIAPEPEPAAPAREEAAPPAAPAPTPIPITEVRKEPERAAALAPEPLPDYVVDPASKAPEPRPVVPPAAPIEEEEEDLGPLPDYIVDPTRQPAPVADVRSRRPDEASSSRPRLVVTPSTESPPDSPAVDFPTTSSFPTLDDRREPEDDRRRESKPSRQRSTPGSRGKARRERSIDEPGDEAQEVGWMQGLSNRLSAYSLNEDEENERPVAETHEESARDDDAQS